MIRKVLVIERDNVTYNDILSILQELEYTVSNIYRFHSVLDAILLPEKEFYAILVSDEILSSTSTPGISELVAYFDHTPVIALSATFDHPVHCQAVASGVMEMVPLKDLYASQLQNTMDIAALRHRRETEAADKFSDYERHFNNGPIPMWIIDAVTLQFLTVNSAAVAKYGYSKEEFAGMSILDIRPKEDVAAMIHSYNQRKTDYFDAGYWRHRKKNGDVFHVHIYSHATLFRNRDARLSFAVDVDEKFNADQKNRELLSLLREQKDILDNILFSISDAIWSRRADTMELTYANNAYHQMFGTSGSVITGQVRTNTFVHPDDARALSSATHDIRSRGSYKIVYRICQPDGSFKVLKEHAIYKAGVGNKPDMINGITQEITREKELWDALRNNEHKLSATINNTNDFIWSVNKELKLIFCNKAFKQFFLDHFNLEVHEGDCVLDMWHNESYVNSRKLDYERAFGGESFTTIIEEHIGDEAYYFEMNSSPIRCHDGSIAGVNCISRNITEQKKQFLRIQQQNERLREIAWIQSHKVRGPVASILGLISILDKSRADPATLEIINQLQDATTELDKVIREVVTTALN